MNRYESLSSKSFDLKLKLYFSKIELNKILKYYSLGVSQGTWKDYAIQFKHNEAYFHIFKNCSEKPLISICKKKYKKHKKYNFQISNGYYNFLSDTNIDNIFVYLKRKDLKLIKNI